MSVSKFPFATLEELAAPEKGSISIGPFGSRMKAEVYVDEGIRVIRGTNISDDSRLGGKWVFVTSDFALSIPNCITRAGDLIFPHRGSIGEVTLIDDDQDPLVISSSMMKYRVDKQKADPRFLAHYFKSKKGRDEILRFASSVGTPGIGQPLTSLRQFRVPKPKLNVQKSIADVLSILNDKIALNRKMNETLEDMAQAVFTDWFVDFGPTERKLQGESDPVKILGGLIPDIKRATKVAAIFPDSLDGDRLPKGWVEKPLDEIANFLNGAALQKFPAEKDADSLPVIKIAQLRNGITKKANRASLDIPKKFLVEDGDFLFSWSGSLLAKFWTEGKGALNQHLFKVTSKDYPKWFFSQWVHYHMREFQMIAESKATTMGHIKRQHLKEARTICPSEEDIVILSEILGPIIDRTIQNDLENQTLAETRDYLLPKLMSGEVSAGDAAAETTTVETTNVIPMGGDLFDRKSLPADKDLERDSAIVAGVISALQKDTEVVGNVKYQKGCYFVYRRMGYSTRDFEQKAAGPYKSDPKYPGNVPARNLSEANALALQYKLGDALAWVKQHLSGKSRGELELWATVDYAMVALRNRRTAPTAETVIDYIRNEPEWTAKLKKASFTKSKIRAAIAQLDTAFAYG